VAENGGEALALGAFPDDEAKLGAAIREAVATCDLVVLSGGTSKGAGDVSHRILAGLPGARIIVHGVALKPGKPLCLALVGDTPVVVLPGFPTSAMFTFHTFVAPLIRAMAGLPEGEGRKVVAVMPQRMPSELGRTEFAFVSLVEGEDGLVAYPTAKGSGAVTAFAQADGFVEVEAERDALNAGERRIVTLIGAETRPPDLTITGSHCLGLDRLVDVLAEEGLTCRLIVVGSTAGLNAARRGECDLAGIHLLDPTSGLYNTPFLGAGLSLLPGWRRRQGIVFRPGDPRFASAADAASAVAAALADPACVMVSRNAGSGTRVLIDGLIAGARPPGFSNQPRSHNAVAVAVAQGRADWGVAIESVARLYGLGFLPLTDEHYDFALPVSRAGSRAVACLAAALDTPAFAAALAELGFSRAPEP
jgi:putative molybdopterin biosynthesis protein